MPDQMIAHFALLHRVTKSPEVEPGCYLIQVASQLLKWPELLVIELKNSPPLINRLTWIVDFPREEVWPIGGSIVLTIDTLILQFETEQKGRGELTWRRPALACPGLHAGARC